MDKKHKPNGDISHGIKSKHRKKRNKKHENVTLNRESNHGSISGDEYTLPVEVLNKASTKKSTAKKAKKPKINSKSENGKKEKRSSSKKLRKSKSKLQSDSKPSNALALVPSSIPADDPEPESFESSADDFYKMLGVPTSANPREVKQAFHSKMQLVDKGEQQVIYEAFDVLRNEYRKTLYDLLGHSMYKDHLDNVESLRNTFHTGIQVVLASQQSVPKRRLSFFSKRVKNKKSTMCLWCDRSMESLFVGPNRAASSAEFKVHSISEISDVLITVDVKMGPRVRICTHNSSSVALKCESMEEAETVRSQLLLVLGDATQNIEWVSTSYGL